MNPCYRLFGIAALVGSALLIGPAGLRADVITQSKSFPAQDTDWSDTFTINQFNPALGTLDAVKFSVNGHIHSELFVQNRNVNIRDVSVAVSGAIGVTNPFDVAHPVMAALSVAHDELLAPGRSFDVFGQDTEAAMKTYLPSATTSFVGTGTIALPVSAKANFTTSGGGNLLSIVTTEADASVTVEYDYTAASVPEPSSLVLFAVGGLGLAVAGWYRRRATRAAR